MILERKVFSGVRWTSLATIFTAAFQILQISILARFLEYSDFGLLAIVMLVIGFSQIFSDMGISSAIIHKQNVTQKQLSTLYWLNIIASIFIYLLIVLLSPIIAEFYNEESLSSLIILTSATFVIQALGKQFLILFEKELKFSVIAKIDIVAAFLGFIFSVFLAINSFGVYSLIYPLILTTCIRSFFQIYIGIRYHKPKFYFNMHEVKGYLSFGFYQMASGVINYFNSQMDVIIIGKIFGSEVLGLYSIIKQLVMRPAQIINPIVSRIAFPAMAKLQSDSQKIKIIYLRVINYLASINFPIYVSMIILAPEIILIFLGEEWLNGVEIFQILSLYALIRSTGNPIGSLVLAKGKPQYEMNWNIVLFFLIPISIFIGSTHDIKGVAWSWVVLILGLVIPNWYFLVNKLCSASFVEYHIQIFKPFLISTASGVVAYYSLQNYRTEFITSNIAIVLVIGFVMVLFMNLIFNKGFIDTIKKMFTGWG